MFATQTHENRIRSGDASKEAARGPTAATARFVHRRLARRLTAFVLLATVCAASMGISTLDASASVLYNQTGIMSGNRGNVAVVRASWLVAEDYTTNPFWVGEPVYTYRYLSASPAVIAYEAPFNRASKMTAQVVLQVYTAKGWVNSAYQSLGLLKGSIISFNYHYMWGFPDWTSPYLPPGSYRTLTTYWFFDASGRQIASMQEIPEARDIALLNASAVGNTGAGQPGWVWLP
jgi:hypothetical protein